VGYQARSEDAWSDFSWLFLGDGFDKGLSAFDIMELDRREND